MFPGLATSLRSKTLSLGSYFPILVVAAYNLSDLLGKAFGNFVVPKRSGLVVLVSLQAAAIPLIILSKYADDVRVCEYAFCLLFKNDVTKLLLVAYLGGLTGYTSTSALILAPQSVTTSQEKNFCGRFMTLALISGLLAGSVVGVLIQKYGVSNKIIDNVSPYPV